MSLKPDIKQMLTIGAGCGLTTVAEAYDNYMNHYDCFFLIDDYQAQNAQFIKDMGDAGFVKDFAIVDMTIEEALASL